MPSLTSVPVEFVKVGDRMAIHSRRRVEPRLVKIIRIHRNDDGSATVWASDNRLKPFRMPPGSKIDVGA